MPIDRCAFRPVPGALALAFYAAGAAANPQGGVVKAGSATIAPNGSRLEVVQSSQRAVIDWRSFSIGAGRSVAFKQPSAASATLNRVTGPEMSAILGLLTANGTVFLVNPNGILIGPGAKIDVGGLVAATANISNENFMAGRYKFDEVVNRNAVIVNRGEITAHAGGLVALVAPGVENSGVIRAELGRVVLASGNRFTLDLFGDKLVTFAVDDKVAARLTDVDGRPLKAYVNQTGRIEADGGSILIAASAAKAVLDNVINTSGVVRATSFVQRGGEIVLNGGDEGVVRVAGTLDASGRLTGASGGSVKVLGAEVVLDAGSRIDIAGDAGGGIALVGGGVRGGDGVPRSSRTAIEGGASVNADALTRGNGGTIVAWSDGETRFAGALSARGGASGGDGGLVEVSGKRTLSFNGAVDAAAPAGKGGRLLLDPDFLTVDAATATAVASVLRSGGNAELTASDTVDVRQPIDGRGGVAGGGLTIDAANAIAVNNDIVTNDGPVVLSAGAGGIAMNAGPAISVTGGSGTVIHAGAAPITLRADGNVTAEHLVTSGPVTVSSALGNVILNRDLAGPSGGGIGSLAVSAAQAAELKGVSATGAVRVETSGSGGTITLDGPIVAIDGPIVADKSVIIGSADRAADTTIRMQNDIHTRNADIELNGTTLVNPRPGAGGLGFLSRSPLLSAPDNTYYDNPFVQVSLQTTGSGSVRFRGDVLWDHTRAPINRIQYLYNRRSPYPFFDPSSEAAVADLRRQEPVRSTGYYGLNVGVELGTVTITGNLGSFDATGKVKKVDGPPDRLGDANPATGLWVTVHTGREDLTSTFAFGASSKIVVSGLRVANTDVPDFVFIDGADLAPALPLPSGNVVLLDRSLPQLTPGSGDPGIIGPGPRNVDPAGSFARLAALPEVPIRPVEDPVAALPTTPTLPDAVAAVPSLPQQPVPSDPGATTGAAAAQQAAEQQARAAAAPIERGARETGDSRIANEDTARVAAIATRGAGVTRDVFAGDAPLAPFAGPNATHADGEYFSQGAFEFAETLSRRTGLGR
jgi:filamentous hemagglutinin family protein